MEFDRFIKLIGEESFNIITQTKILIVGIGGVGGYTLESLVRSGIKDIVIIDNDQIDITNLNRQILALKSNIGLFKTDVAMKRYQAINSEVKITPIKEFLTKDNMNILENYKFDYIIDCCDTVSTKIELIKYAKNKNIKIISCMGTGRRLDATKVVITTLDKTYNNPLAKIMRQNLRKENINLKIPVVTSVESAVTSNSKEIASCSYVPGVAGLYVTNYIINDIIKSYH